MNIGAKRSMRRENAGDHFLPLLFQSDVCLGLKHSEQGDSSELTTMCLLVPLIQQLDSDFKDIEQERVSPSQIHEIFQDNE